MGNQPNWVVALFRTVNEGQMVVLRLVKKWVQSSGMRFYLSFIFRWIDEFYFWCLCCALMLLSCRLWKDFCLFSQSRWEILKVYKGHGFWKLGLKWNAGLFWFGQNRPWCIGVGGSERKGALLRLQNSASSERTADQSVKTLSWAEAARLSFVRWRAFANWTWRINGQVCCAEQDTWPVDCHMD